MPKKNNEVVHWTLEEERKILDAIPSIRKESGKYLLSTKSETFRALKKQFYGRSEMALNGKVREMLKQHGYPAPLFTFDDVEEQQPQQLTIPTSIRDAVDSILREFYGEVDYDTFVRFQDHLNKFQ